MVEFQFRGVLRTRTMRTLWNSTKIFCTWGGVRLCISIGWEQSCWKRHGVHGGPQAEHDPPVCGITTKFPRKVVEFPSMEVFGMWVEKAMADTICSLQWSHF